MTRVTETLTRTRSAPGRAIGQHLGGLLLCLTLLPTVVTADAGMANMDAGVDGGTNAPDAGPGPRDAGFDAGRIDAGATQAPFEDKCSCESASGSGDRRIHLCTGSDGEACSRLTCKRGTPRDESCGGTANVWLCCDMKARDLYTYLYRDCTHPNCETGFRAQCADFAGDVYAGACAGEDPGDDNGGNGGGPELEEGAACSVGQVGVERSLHVGVGLCALSGVVALRRRRRARSRRQSAQ